jgi:hypothetical protein
MARRGSGWAVAGTALLLGLAAGCGKDAAKPTGFEGTFRGTVAGETKTIRLRRTGDVVTVELDGTTAEGRVVSPTRVEVKQTEEIGVMTLLLDLEGNDRLRPTITVEIGGEKTELPAEPFVRVADAAPAGTASGGGGEAPAPSGGGAADAAIAGHWRHTETLGSGEFFLVTDTHLVLGADGTFETWTKSANSGESQRMRGAWKTEGGRLHFQEAGTWTEVGRYQQNGSHLMITASNGAKRVYERL